MAHGRIRFGGAPEDLKLSDLPTFGDIAKCYWKACESETTFKGHVKFVEQQLLSVWSRCSELIPLLRLCHITQKLERFLEKVRDSKSDKKLRQAQRDDLDRCRDTLFDVSACNCELPIVTCRNVRVNCRLPSCSTTHIICLCPPDRRIPAEECAYMRDQRHKVGTHGGNFRMAGPDFNYRS
jgi:hypothetical protein